MDKLLSENVVLMIHCSVQCTIYNFTGFYVFTPAIAPDRALLFSSQIQRPLGAPRLSHTDPYWKMQIADYSVLIGMVVLKLQLVLIEVKTCFGGFFF
jgi:lipoprotein signal peptidase